MEMLKTIYNQATDGVVSGLDACMAAWVCTCMRGRVDEWLGAWVTVWEYVHAFDDLWGNSWMVAVKEGNRILSCISTTRVHYCSPKKHCVHTCTHMHM